MGIMVRNGVSVPIYWHIFVQVGPRRVVPLVLDPMVVVYGDCGASSPDKKKGAGEQVGVCIAG